MKKKLILTLLALSALYYNAYPSYYASMYMLNESTNLISGTLAAGSELQVTGYSELNCSGWTFSSSTLTAGSSAAGTYQLKYSLSFEGEVGLWTIKIYKNSTLLSEIINKRKIGSSGDVGNASASGLVSISSGDAITIKVSCDVDASTFTPVHSQVELIPVKSAADAVVGEMYINDEDNNNTPISLTADTWTSVTGFSAGALNGFTFSSDGLTVPSGKSGYYSVTYSVSFSTGSSGSAGTFTVGLSFNGNVPDTLLLARYLSGTYDRGNATFTGVVYLTAGDVLTLKVKADNNNYFDPRFTTLSVSPLDISSTAYYGCSYISNNTASMAVNDDGSWTQITGFSAGSLNSEWTSSSSKLTPSSSADGFYKLTLSMAITYADVEATGYYIYPEIAVFVNGTAQDNLYFERKLQKKDNADYGSLSGTCFVRIDDVSDTITAFIKEKDGKDITVLDANISLIQISPTSNLPVTLAQFQGKALEEGNLLRWTTFSETDNDYFAVEKSDDGINFLQIAKVQGSGNSNTPKEYSFTDRDIKSTKSYYRLKQVDYNGNFEYSKTICLYNWRKLKIKSYYSGGYLYIENLNSETVPSAIVVFDASGKCVLTHPAVMEKDTKSCCVPVNLPPGIYFIKLVEGEKVISTNKLAVF